jgi:HD-GYP domain-containing protein (c-di-GMP phosphodiesterase class II)
MAFRRQTFLSIMERIMPVIDNTIEMQLPPEIPSPLSLLLELGQAFHSTLELDPLLATILRQMQSAAQSEDVSIWLLDAPHTRLTCTHAVGPEAAGLIGRSLPAAAVLYGDEALVPVPGDGAAQGPGQPTSGAQVRIGDAFWGGARSVIMARLEARGELLGTLTVANKLGQTAFSEADRALVTALAGHAAVAIQNAQLYEQQRRNNERQRLLEQISRHMQQTLDTEVLIPLILEEVNKAIEADAQSLWLLDIETGLIVCTYATGPGGEAIKKVTVPLGMGIVGSSVASQTAIMIPDAQSDERVFKAADQQTGFVTRSLLCVPLVRQGKSIGAIEAVNKHGGNLFGQDDLELLRNIADSAALSIENARLYADLSASYDGTLDALTAALDLRDRETEGHSRRVVEYTARLARQMGLPEAEIRNICRGALIHDIGKIGVPDAILLKPGLLEPEERRIMEKHPIAGYEMLLGVPYLEQEMPIVLAHQEHWDGTGYPFGLKGREIPLGARLFAIADTFDALTSDRPYRLGRSCDEALVVIAAEAGRQFDPEAVAAFMMVPSMEWEAIRAEVFAEVGRRRARQAERVRQGRRQMQAGAR